MASDIVAFSTFQSHMNKSIFLTAFLAIILLLTSCSNTTPPMPKLDGTEPVPHISLPTPNGDTLSVDSFHGKVVFINFWGTYCPPCVAELPELQQLYDELKDDDLVIIGLNAEEKPEKVKTFIEKNHITFPIIISDDATINAIFGLKHMPTTWFVDRKGILRGKIEGQISKNMARKIANQLLNEP